MTVFFSRGKDTEPVRILHVPLPVRLKTLPYTLQGTPSDLVGYQELRITNYIFR